MQVELRDIHLPDPVSWWPPAPGWYGVLLILMLLLLAAAWLIIRRRHPSIKKLAMRELQHIEQAFSQHRNSQQLCSEISILLRRVAMSYDSRNNQAGVTGKEWLNHLNDLAGQPLFDVQLSGYLLFAPYQKQSTEPADKLITVTRQWILLLPERRFVSRLLVGRKKKMNTPATQPGTGLSDRARPDKPETTVTMP